MKKPILFIFATIFLLGSCKKSPLPPPGISTIKHTPAYIALAYQPGLPTDLSEFNIYDLDHDNNSDKQYFRVAIYTDDSARVIVTPRSIDSIALGWPPSVKNIRWSSGAEFIIDMESYVRVNGNTFQRINYNQSSPQHAWLSQYKSTVAATGTLPDGELNYGPGDFRLMFLSIRMASVFDRQDPQGNAMYKFVDFKECFGQVFVGYDFRDVSQFIFFKNIAKFYFFDFKNWKYFWIAKTDGLNTEYKAGPIRSLDRFVKWPEGWGKK